MSTNKDDDALKKAEKEYQEGVRQDKEKQLKERKEKQGK